MPHELFKTKIKRTAKKNKSGRKSKRKKQNSGTTDSFPMTGPIPTMKYGKKVPDSQVVVKS